MNSKIFSNLLLFSLFGLALSFFGMLYEGVVIIPNMLALTPEKMQFWHSFYLFINPIIYYIPLVPLATVMLILLYFLSKQQNIRRRALGMASLSQIGAMAITAYIITQINLKMYFGNIENYAALLPTKTLLVNILSVTRLIFSAFTLLTVFRTCIKSQQV